MLCERFKEICSKYGWAVSDNGSDPIILCRQIEQGYAFNGYLYENYDICHKV